MAPSASKFKSKFQKEKVPDLVLMPKISEEEIVSTLKKRYMDDSIYTYIGTVVIAVNPFKKVDICDESHIEEYRGASRHENEPHLFALADQMYKNVYSLQEDQCVIISGESGAGKTESAKLIMTYITKVSGTSSDPNAADLKQIIYESNPLLESFGNAKTLRNNNSSRFGKYFEIFFDQYGCPNGGKLYNFLLEKVRVVHQNTGERSFHIFYQLLAGASQQEVDAFQLYAPENFYYLNQSQCYQVDTIDDVKDYAATRHAMDVMGFSSDEQWSLMQTLAGVLHLGNIQFFDDNNVAQISDNGPLEIAAGLFGVPSDILAQKLTSHFLQTGAGGGRGSTYNVPLNAEQACYARDSLAKALYSRAFDWIIERVNTTMVLQSPNHSIGILDIYGFEIFEHNGFEQFCINYVNEKLQQIFIELTLKAEQEEYVKEGIEWTPIKFLYVFGRFIVTSSNNKVVCDLIEGKSPPGIFAILDDVCFTLHAQTEGADDTFVQKCSTLVGSHEHFAARAPGFLIKHYAGDVQYGSEGFTDRNKDVLFKDLIQIMQMSTVPFIVSLFPEDTNVDDRKRPISAGNKIRNQCSILVQQLAKTTPHYVRTVKPNDNKKAHEYDDARVREQVRYLGMVENVRIRRAGFADRQPFGRFFNRYCTVCPETYPYWKGSDKDGCIKICEYAGIKNTDYQVGLSKLFLKFPETLFALEELRERRYHEAATKIQRAFRSWSSRKYFLTVKKKACDIFVGKKERRRGSLNRIFVGDYIGYRDNHQLKQVIKSVGPTEAFKFGDNVNKYDRRFTAQSRIFVITDKSLYFIALEKTTDKTKPKGTYEYVIKRQLKLEHVARLSLSPLADNYIVIHVNNGEHDQVFESARKTELVTMLAELIPKADIQFQNNIGYIIKKGKGQNISFLVDAMVPQPTMKKGVVHVPTGLDKNSRPEVEVYEMKAGVVAKKQQRRADGYAYEDEERNPYKGRRVPPQAADSTTATNVKKAKVVFDYDANESDELTVKTGDVIEIVDDSDKGWWKGKDKNGKVGLVPASYVEKIAAPAPKSAPSARGGATAGAATRGGVTRGSASAGRGKTAPSAAAEEEKPATTPSTRGTPPSRGRGVAPARGAAPTRGTNTAPARGAPPTRGSAPTRASPARGASTPSRGRAVSHDEAQEETAAPRPGPARGAPRGGRAMMPVSGRGRAQ